MEGPWWLRYSTQSCRHCLRRTWRRIRPGAPIPNIICQQFQDLFATFGGCGSALSLMIAMLLFCRSKRIRELGKLSLVPGLFGINEPIVFGLPIVLNPRF